MVTEYDMDTTWSTLVTHFIREQTDTFAPASDSILQYIKLISVAYGKKTSQRPVQDPDTIVKIGKEFNSRRSQIVTHTQNLDLANVSKGYQIPRATFANDPEGARIHITDAGSVFREGLEKLFIEGASVNVVTRGVSDYPNGTTGTINRPEMAYDGGAGASSGDWSTTANIRADIIEGLQGLILKRFFGPYIILAPTIVRPMLTEVISNTAVPINQWVKSSAGVNVAFSPFVHEAATKDDFNFFIVDINSLYLAITATMLDFWYEKKDHAYYWDCEVYAVPMFDIRFDGTDYMKGVARFDARDWSD